MSKRQGDEQDVPAPKRPAGPLGMIDGSSSVFFGTKRLLTSANSQGNHGRDNFRFLQLGGPEDVDILNLNDVEIIKLADTKGFPPLFLHQHFVNEIIQGWKKLAVIILITPAYRFYLRIIGETYEEETRSAMEKLIHDQLIFNVSHYGGILHHDSQFQLHEDVVHAGDKNVFRKLLIGESCDDPPVFGDIYQRESRDGEELLFCQTTFGFRENMSTKSIRDTESKEASLEADGVVPSAKNGFHGFHRRLEWLMHFFIEACSPIIYDDSWRVFMLFRHPCTDKEKDEGFINSSTVQLVSIGTVYDYLPVPLFRRKVSQFFTNPALGGKGYGAALLESIYHRSIATVELQEMTVEEPALGFAQLRDFVCLQVAIHRGLLTKSHFLADDEKKSTPSDSLHSVAPVIEGIGTAQFMETPGGYLIKCFGSKTEMEEAAVKTLQNLSNWLRLLNDALRNVIKESRMQVQRLVEIILVAKFLPSDWNSCLESLKKEEEKGPFDKKKSIINRDVNRSFRERSIGEDAVIRIAGSDFLTPARLFVKMRIALEADLVPLKAGDGPESFLTKEQAIAAGGELGKLNAEGVKYLQLCWQEFVFSAMRTVIKLRQEPFTIK